MGRLHCLLNLTRRSLVPLYSPEKPFSFSCLSLEPRNLQNPSPKIEYSPQVHSFNFLSFQRNSSTCFYSNLRSFSATTGSSQDAREDTGLDDFEEDLVIEEWEEEDDAEPEINDGGAGGGIVLQNVPWGERVLSLAREVLLQCGDDIMLYAFKATPRGYIYVRLDKLSNEYGCPSMKEIEGYSKLYKKRLEEEGSKGDIPEDLALEVSSPGAERLLRVPDDLHRFKDFPVVVTYVEGDTEGKYHEKNGFFFLDSIETETEQCVWKLADVKENRDLSRKGRPLSRKLKDWRLKLPYSMLKKVTLYLEF